LSKLAVIYLNLCTNHMLFLFFAAVMLEQCLDAFATCAIRFPLHYKSVFRLAHFYYRSKQRKNLDMCRELLLGNATTSKGVIGGLFADRKNTNFFNVS